MDAPVCRAFIAIKLIFRISCTKSSTKPSRCRRARGQMDASATLSVPTSIQKERKQHGTPHSRDIKMQERRAVPCQRHDSLRQRRRHGRHAHPDHARCRGTRTLNEWKKSISPIEPSVNAGLKTGMSLTAHLHARHTSVSRWPRRERDRVGARWRVQNIKAPGEHPCSMAYQ